LTEKVRNRSIRTTATSQSSQKALVSHGRGLWRNRLTIHQARPVAATTTRPGIKSAKAMLPSRLPRWRTSQSENCKCIRQLTT